MLTKNKFMKRFYQLDMEKKKLYVYDVTKECKLKQVFDFSQTDVRVHSGLQRTLRSGYSREIKEQILLDEIYDRPFAVIYSQRDMMLLWAATQSDFDIWTKAFQGLNPNFECKDEKDLDINKTSKNSFVTTLYKWLRPVKLVSDYTVKQKMVE